ncbi:hypothetical protein MHBO_002285 [Bonamia ostreae]|uniref:LicD/FKTN/FKRP nucleotidyltransferase domain-containing protein n=1 Tax=Bonamia ostreae TaxID=126728 RepID=A0ABV2AMU5_9EUKA
MLFLHNAKLFSFKSNFIHPIKIETIEKPIYYIDNSTKTKIPLAHSFTLTAFPEKPQTTFYESKDILDERLLPFKRRMSKQEFEKGVRLLQALSKAFKQNNVTWWLSHGTLLGQQYFQSVIPWDDDIDIKVVGAQLSIFRILSDFCRNNPTFKVSTFNSKNRMKIIKFYFRNGDEISGFTHKFPFVDIFPVQIGEKRVKHVTNALSREENLEDLFPLKNGLFGSFLFPIPRKPLKILTQNYFRGYGYWKYCINGYDHRRERATKRSKILAKYLFERYGFFDHEIKTFKKPGGDFAYALTDI